jgi:hypothetical protein
MTKILIDEAVAGQALEALEQIAGAMPFPVGKQSIAALRQALEQPAQWGVHQQIALNKMLEQPAPAQEPVVLAGQGRDLHHQLMEAAGALLRAQNEPERWGCVGPSPIEIAWDKFSHLASHVCTGIDSPPAPAQPLTDEQCCHVCGKPLKTVAHGITKEN